MAQSAGVLMTSCLLSHFPSKVERGNENHVCSTKVTDEKHEERDSSRNNGARNKWRSQCVLCGMKYCIYKLVLQTSLRQLPMCSV